MANEVMGYRCPACKTVNPKDVKYCLNCGTWLLDTKFPAEPVIYNVQSQPDKKKTNFKKLGCGCLTIIAAIFVILVIIGITSSSKKTATPPQTVTTAKIGEIATNNGYALVVNKVDVGVDYEWAHPDPGNQFAIANVTIENERSSNIDYNEWDFKLQDSNGNITQLSMMGAGADIKWLGSGELIPGGTITGSVPFEISSNSKPVKLLWDPGFPASTVTVDVQ